MDRYEKRKKLESEVNRMKPTIGSARVLLVEDDSLTLKTMSRLFESIGFDVVVAADGEEACAVIQKDKKRVFDCVVTDFRMPRMNGIELIVWLKQYDAHLSVIIMTGDDDKMVVKNALKVGAFDYVEKPISIIAIGDIVRKAVENTHRNRKLNSVASDVKTLSNVTTRLNRNTFRGFKNVDGQSLKVTSLVYPIKETGGDFFNTWSNYDQQLFLLVGDVSGHDLGAGYISAYFQGIGRGMLEQKAKMEEISEFFNHYLINEWNRVDSTDPFAVGTSLCACCIVFDLKNMTLEVHNNGIPCPLIVNGSESHILGEPTPPLGWFEELMGKPQLESIQAMGYCYVWTDGLTDYALQNGVSPHALAYCLYREKNEIKRQLLIEGHDDDVLLIRVEWQKDERVCPPEVLVLETYNGDKMNDIDRYQALWESTLKMVFPEMDDCKCIQILLCCREALLNAFQHGCKHDKKLKCHINLSYISANDELIACIFDEGAGFDPQNSASGQTDAEGHTSYGLILLHHFSKRLQYSEDGRQLTITFAMNELCSFN